MTNLTEFTFLSSDGKTRLHAMQCCRWKRLVPCCKFPTV